jgi:triacylglycerol lipase
VIVVMVHGFADTGRLFGSLSRSLSAQGHVCHAPTLSPRDARLGIPDLSGKLAEFIRATVPPGESIALVGFSMGALVARHYLQSREGIRSALAFFSIAGPHQGTFSARLYPGEGTRQMRPGSAFLRELDAGLPALDGLPLFTYRTPMDLMVNPARTTRLPRATEMVVWCPFHSMLPGFPRVKAHIGREIARLAQSGRPPSLGVVTHP